MIPDSPAENTRLSIADRGDMHGEYGQDIPKSESPELGTTIYSVPPSNHGTPAEDEELQPTGGRDLFLKPSIPASKFPSTKLSASVTPSKQLKNFDVASQFVESESKPDGRLKRPSRPVVDDSPGQKYRKSPSVKRPGRDVFDPITSDIEYSQESPFNQGFRKPSMGSLIETASKQSIERNRRTGIQKLDAENSQILYTTGNANGKHLDKRAGTPAKSMQHDRVDNTKKKSVKDKTPLSIARTPVKATTPISKMTPAQKLQDKADRKAQDIAKRLAKALEKERASEETINLHPIAFSGSDGVRKSSTPLIPGKNSRRTPGSSRKRIVNGMPSRATTLEVQVPLPNGLLNGSRSSSNSLQRSVSFVEDQKSSDEGMGLGVETKVLASEDSQLLPMENSEFRSSSSNELSKIHEGIIRRTPSKDLKTGRTQPIMKSSAAMVQTKLEVITNKGKGRMEDRSTFNDDTRVEDPLEFRESNGTSPAFTRGNNEDTLIQHAGAAAFDMDTVPEKVEIKANKMSSSGEKLEHGPSESLPDAAPIRDSRDEDDAVQSDEPMVAGEESSRDASEPVFEKRSVASASRSPARIVIPSSTGSENEDVDEEEEEDEDDDDDDDENDSEDEDEDEDEGYKDEDQDEKVREADTSNSRVGPEGEPHSDQEEPETLKATVLTNGHRSTIDADGILPSTEPSWNLAAVTNELATSKSDVPEAVPAEPDLSSQSSSSEEDREDTTEEEGKDHNVNKQKPDYETESDSDGCIKGDLAAQQLHRESRHCNELSRSQTKNVLPTAIGQHDRSVVGASPLAPSSTVLSSRGQPRPVNSRLPSMSEMKQRGVKVGNTTQTTKLLSPFSSSENGARSGITPKVAGHSKSDDSSDSEEDSDPEDSLTGLNKGESVTLRITAMRLMSFSSRFAVTAFPTTSQTAFLKSN